MALRDKAEHTREERGSDNGSISRMCKRRVRRIVCQKSFFKGNNDEQVGVFNLKSGSTTIKFKMDLRSEVTVICKETLQEMIPGTRWSGCG